MARTVDGVFISYYEDIDRWGNDHAPSRSGPTGSPALQAGEARGPAPGAGQKVPGKDTLIHRMGRQSVGIDGGNHDLARFLSRVRYDTSIEYRRYDAFTPTHLTGAYYESLARRHGYELYHVNHATRVDLERLAPTLQPRFVFVSTTYMTETHNIMDAARHARANWPGVPLVMGGLVLVELSKSLPNGVFQSLLRAFGADAYVISPLGEAAFLKLLANPGKELGDLELPKTWVRRGADFVVDEALDEPGLDIDANHVRWDLLDPAQLYHTVHTRTARSCAFVCSFCSYVSNQGPLTLSSPETLRVELEQLSKIPHVKSLIFTDDTFNVPLARFKEMLKVLQDFDFEWYSYYRAQFTDEDCAQAMVDSGCRAVFLGIESIDDKVLRNMKKAATRKAYTRGMRELKKAGIATHANFIIGFPGDVASNTPDLVDWIDSEGVDFFTVTPWYCSPATPVGTKEEKERFGVVGNFWRWRHDTMDSNEALELERWAIENARHSVFMSELAAQCFWSEIILYSNGFTTEEARELVRAFNLHAGRDQRWQDLRSTPEIERARAILLGREVVAPPGSTHFRTDLELEHHLQRAQAGATLAR